MLFNYKQICKPNSVLNNHLSGDTVASVIMRPYQKQSGQLYKFHFGLAPSGVYIAIDVANNAVSSYLTFPPLPKNGGLFLLHYP